MQVACTIIERWCNDNGLSDDPPKMDAILTVILYGKPTYLGVNLDRKLS